MKNFIILLFCTGSSLACLSQNVVQAEYFIDTDLGYGNNTLVTLTLAADGTFPLAIPVSSYPPGHHKLYIRTKGSDESWSLTARRNIDVFESVAKTTIVTGEYFIDTDPGFGMGTPITINTPDSSVVLQNFSAETAGLSPGYHKLYGRLKDNLGRWTITFRRNMEVYSESINVINGEYFFTSDEGFGNCSPVTFAVPAADGSFVIDIPRSSIPMGADTLFVRVRDDINNRWSITQILGNISGVLPLTLLNFSVTKQESVAQLAWQTSNEINTSHFNIQRSINGTNFATISRVNAIPGNVLRRDYTYPDNVSALHTGKVYYRLQMADKDGKFSYSRIVFITLSNSPHPKIYPNPAHGYFVIGNYDKSDTRTASILVRDLMGRTLINRKFTNDSEQKIDIGTLSKGMYMVSILTPGNVQTQKLIVE